MIVATVMMIVLAGCEASVPSQGGPGSVTVYLHGRMDAGFSAVTR
jgi:hypothetical protein